MPLIMAKLEKNNTKYIEYHFNHVIIIYNIYNFITNM